MGCLFSRLLSYTSGRESPGHRLGVLLVGLEGSGKTSILYRLKIGDFIPTVPTTSVLSESFDVYVGSDAELFNLRVWEACVGRRESKWRPYQRHAEAVIFVLDSTDARRLSEARAELLSLVFEEHFLTRKAKFLIFANKQDLPHALSPTQIAEHLSLPDDLSDRTRLIPCSVVTGEGLKTGLEWLCVGDRGDMHRHAVSRGSGGMAEGGADFPGMSLFRNGTARPRTSSPANSARAPLVGDRPSRSAGSGTAAGGASNGTETGTDVSGGAMAPMQSQSKQPASGGMIRSKYAPHSEHRQSGGGLGVGDFTDFTDFREPHKRQTGAGWSSLEAAEAGQGQGGSGRWGGDGGGGPGSVDKSRRHKINRGRRRGDSGDREGDLEEGLALAENANPNANSLLDMSP
uniref:ADP-ribosylation factor n=1 Tax=Chromera velia CCMP2878 TaxID=1169474 RepID=A0A0G4IEC8_9ALVE|eukprot:Cvel_13679.t1-p1 / transcript=Cvel_13679.t1 / gene=Cvel_13679 / organism=Chromera_velia_CCMP2878 / gene_product=ADP-ribosylation factor 1, putative / transcript_product=ADP-ribosylation factor 1, putative / location=Cvel_scaffold945:7411-10821(-) / protein_length=401 / sequence_SO=supercontig / SO=protein_coding / is_pseudo=false